VRQPLEVSMASRGVNLDALFRTYIDSVRQGVSIRESQLSHHEGTCVGQDYVESGRSTVIAPVAQLVKYVRSPSHYVGTEKELLK
jgi:hypothetical protein